MGHMLVRGVGAGVGVGSVADVSGRASPVYGRECLSFILKRLEHRYRPVSVIHKDIISTTLKTASTEGMGGNLIGGLCATGCRRASTSMSKIGLVSAECICGRAICNCLSSKRFEKLKWAVTRTAGIT